MIKLLSPSASATQAFAAKMVPYLQGGQVIVLEGHLGTGKTTFTQGLGRALGISRAIKSPTYTIVKEYDLPEFDYRLIHIDAYRLEEGGADSIDLEAYLTKDNLVVIEWAQFVKDYLPKDYVQINFEVQENLNKRQITIKNVGDSNSNSQFINRLAGLTMED